MRAGCTTREVTKRSVSLLDDGPPERNLLPSCAIRVVPSSCHRQSYRPPGAERESRTAVFPAARWGRPPGRDRPSGPRLAVPAPSGRDPVIRLRFMVPAPPTATRPAAGCLDRQSRSARILHFTRCRQPRDPSGAVTGTSPRTGAHRATRIRNHRRPKSSRRLADGQGRDRWVSAGSGGAGP